MKVLIHKGTITQINIINVHTYIIVTSVVIYAYGSLHITYLVIRAVTVPAANIIGTTITECVDNNPIPDIP